jgi:Pyridoxamine 5'-phosphate oxidase
MWIDQRGSEILTSPEILRLLAVAAKENHIGRLAVNDSQSPLVVPLNFTIHERGVLLRIGPGRLSEMVPGSLVSFEVDSVDPERGEAWSVLIRGLASVLDPSGYPLGVGAMPQPLVPNPGELMIFIRPDVVTGRRFHLIARDGADPVGIG